jgi:hypothetical protein
MDVADIGASNEGVEGAKVGGNVHLFQFLDGSHDAAVVSVIGSTTSRGVCVRRGVMQVQEMNKDRKNLPLIEAICMPWTKLKKWFIKSMN